MKQIEDPRRATGKAIRIYKSRLAGLKRRKRFIPRGESGKYAERLESMLNDLASAVNDPDMGVALVADFFRLDEVVLNNCDDSYGNVGVAYAYAADLFVSYARRCKEKGWIINLLQELALEDSYGVRSELIERAPEFLPEPHVWELIEWFRERAEGEADEYERRHWLILARSLAKELKNGPLYEELQTSILGEIPPTHALDVARVYFEGGDWNGALLWVNRALEGGGELDVIRLEAMEVLLKIYERLGNYVECIPIARDLFRSCPSRRAFERLLSFAGRREGHRILEEEVAIAFEDPSLNYGWASFFVEMGMTDKAEKYLVERRKRLNGSLYPTNLSLAEALEEGGRWLGATVLYRALLDSILGEARVRAYGHGVRYLLKLDKLAEFVEDWGDVEDHSSYFKSLEVRHGRKRSFWEKYYRRRG